MTTGAKTGRKRTGIGIATAVAAVAIVGFLAMMRWDDWHVNFDGGMYLALATNLRRGAGFVFPDGAFATFRGPMYPAAIAGVWLLVADTARNAIWVSRLILIANAVLLTLIVWRLSKRWLAALLAGVVIAVQPLVLVSGALFFVPDGAMVLFVLSAVLVYVWHRESAPSVLRLGFVGGLIGISFLAKQTGALGGLIVVGLLVSAPRGGIRELLRGVPPLGLGFLAPVAAWSVYALVEWGRLPTGVPGLDGVAGGLVTLGALAALLMVWAVAAERLPVDAVSARFPPWAAVLAALFISWTGLALLGAGAIEPVAELWKVLPRDLLDRLYRDTPWGLLLAPLAVAIGWGAIRLSTLGALVGSLVTVVGFAGIIYATLTGSGLRNGILVIYGLAILLALAAGELWSAPKHRVWWRAMAVVGIVAALVGSWAGSDAVNERLPEQAITAENPAVVDAAGWLTVLEPGTVVAGTPLYLSTMWRLAQPHPTIDLVPLHTIGRSEWDSGQRIFPHRVDWAGTVPDPTLLNDPIGISSSRVQLSAFMDATLMPYLEQTQPEYLIVTGNVRFSRSAFDGGLLLPFLEASSSAHAVYRSEELLLPQWVMIYELSYPFVAPETLVIVHGAADAPLEAIASDGVLLTSSQYHDMVVEILRHPVG